MDVIVGGQRLEPGTKTIVRLPVTTDLDGSAISVRVHALRGTRSGRTLVIVGGQHGDEWKNVDLLRQAVEMLDPARLSGTVLVVPVANPIAFGTGQRIVQPASDGPDLNRVWPGTHTWLAESLARVIDRDVLVHADAVLDCHLGPWGSAFGAVFYGEDYPDPSVNAATAALGRAMGYQALGHGKVVQVFPGERSLMGYAGVVRRVPAVGVEIGGLGFDTQLEAEWTADGLRCIRNALRHLDILDTPFEYPERILRYGRTVRVNPSVGGLLIPERDPDQLLREVHAGEVLGRVVSPYTFEDLEVLESPCDGYVMYLPRRYPVRPGQWAFGIIDAASTEWIAP